jgi:hypothetical protein
VVQGEHEPAVLLVVEELDALHAVAVGLVDVDAVLGRVRKAHVADDEPVGAVGADAHLLQRLGRPAQLRVGVLGQVDDRVLRLGAASVDLEVAADAPAVVRDPVPVLPRRVRRRCLRERAALDVDQVLVVRAVHLVA